MAPKTILCKPPVNKLLGYLLESIFSLARHVATANVRLTWMRIGFWWRVSSAIAITHLMIWLIAVRSVTIQKDNILCNWSNKRAKTKELCMRQALFFTLYIVLVIVSCCSILIRSKMLHYNPPVVHYTSHGVILIVIIVVDFFRILSVSSTHMCVYRAPAMIKRWQVAGENNKNSFFSI